MRLYVGPRAALARYACEVVAPAKIARRPGDRIKTDGRDALLLARAARAGELVNVMIPDERDEGLRELSRAREDAVRARLSFPRPREPNPSIQLTKRREVGPCVLDKR